MSLLRALFGLKRTGEFKPDISTNYQIIENPTIFANNLNGWLDDEVAQHQEDAFASLLQELFNGRPRRDFVVAADAIRSTGLNHPSLLEVGCGSGYYYDVFRRLLEKPVGYTGLDFSAAMIAVGRRKRETACFVRGDAVQLPFKDASFDIVFNGVSLMHISQYEKAIAEGRRVSRRFCIFHTVPVLQRRQTTRLLKAAYGKLVFEITFNETEFVNLLSGNGLEIMSDAESIPYNLEAVLGEKTITKTYLCRIKE